MTIKRSESSRPGIALTDATPTRIPSPATPRTRVGSSVTPLVRSGTASFDLSRAANGSLPRSSSSPHKRTYTRNDQAIQQRMQQEIVRMRTLARNLSHRRDLASVVRASAIPRASPVRPSSPSTSKQLFAGSVTSRGPSPLASTSTAPPPPQPQLRESTRPASRTAMRQSLGASTRSSIPQRPPSRISGPSHDEPLRSTTPTPGARGGNTLTQSTRAPTSRRTSLASSTTSSRVPSRAGSSASGASSSRAPSAASQHAGADYAWLNEEYVRAPSASSRRTPSPLEWSTPTAAGSSKSRLRKSLGASFGVGAPPASQAPSSAAANPRRTSAFLGKSVGPGAAPSRRPSMR